MEDWAQFEGQVVDGQFPLRRYLGGGVHSAVFLTEYKGGQAAIKFVPYSAPQLAAWEAAAQLEHPNLMRIFAGGEHRLGETDCAYVVTEYADDSLAPILAERHLTPFEAHDMLSPVASALAYLHGRGFVHGHLKASNIMGIGDRIGLSSDTISRGGEGSPAGDCRALGAILRQAIPSLPAPFLEITQHCLDPNPQSRWTAAMIENRLRGRGIAPPQRPAGSGMWLRLGLVAGAVLVLAAAAFWFSRRSSPAAVPAATITTPAKPPTVTEPKRAGSDGVLNEVLPEIPQAARDTITGRVRVNVRVAVDRAGAVTEATLEPPKASKYFSDRVLAAARRWKFRPSATPQEWNLRFELFPNDTKVSASRAGN
jgi:TonB family protein